jgi:hypothetical protein
VYKVDFLCGATTTIQRGVYGALQCYLLRLGFVLIVKLDQIFNVLLATEENRRALVDTGRMNVKNARGPCRGKSAGLKKALVKSHDQRWSAIRILACSVRKAMGKASYSSLNLPFFDFLSFG